MTPEAANLYALIRSLRLGFNRLKALADDMHGDLGVTASMRAVMEAIATEGARPVPDIARSRGVSRQHIQVNVDALLNAGLATQRGNPAHKRSPIIALSAKGKRTFATMRRREAKVLEQLAAGLSPESVIAAGQTITALNEVLVRFQMDGDENAPDT